MNSGGVYYLERQTENICRFKIFINSTGGLTFDHIKHYQLSSKRMVVNSFVLWY